MSEERAPPEQGVPESGAVYLTVTRYWPRIAVGLVVLAGLTEWLAEGLTADSGIQFYVFAWASVTGGLWFLFEKAEKALGEESRTKVVGWLGETDLRGSVESIPQQFALLFDRVFGERHLSWRCLRNSALASLVGVAVVMAGWIALAWPRRMVAWRIQSDTVSVFDYHLDLTFFLHEGVYIALVLAVVVNILPDYLSLLESRWIIRWWGRRGGIVRGLTADVVLTTAISLAALFVIPGWLLYNPVPDQSVLGEKIASCPACPDEAYEYYTTPYDAALDLLTLAPSFGDLYLPAFDVKESPGAIPDTTTSFHRRERERRRERALQIAVLRLQQDSSGVPEDWLDWGWAEDVEFARNALKPNATDSEIFAVWGDGSIGVPLGSRPPSGDLPFGVFFYSAFFTSVWLWLYAASVMVSRVLVRMGGGVGFLLRVTDVERQPFRSMGFTAVVLTSLLFLAGLPLVLL